MTSFNSSMGGGDDLMPPSWLSRVLFQHMLWPKGFFWYTNKTMSVSCFKSLHPSPWTSKSKLRKVHRAIITSPACLSSFSTCYSQQMPHESLHKLPTHHPVSSLPSDSQRSAIQNSDLCLEFPISKPSSSFSVSAPKPRKQQVLEGVGSIAVWILESGIRLQRRIPMPSGSHIHGL